MKFCFTKYCLFALAAASVGPTEAFTPVKRAFRPSTSLHAKKENDLRVAAATTFVATFLTASVAVLPASYAMVNDLDLGTPQFLVGPGLSGPQLLERTTNAPKLSRDIFESFVSETAVSEGADMKSSPEAPREEISEVLQTNKDSEEATQETVASASPGKASDGPSEGTVVLAEEAEESDDASESTEGNTPELVESSPSNERQQAPDADGDMREENTIASTTLSHSDETPDETIVEPQDEMKGAELESTEKSSHATKAGEEGPTSTQVTMDEKKEEKPEKVLASASTDASSQVLKNEKNEEKSGMMLASVSTDPSDQPTKTESKEEKSENILASDSTRQETQDEKHEEQTSQ